MQKLLIPVALLASLGHYSYGQTTPADPKPAEFYRPQYHFTAPKNWINDPNGLIYSNGEYHLFYQHNPFANVWGHMSWGHAVSKDLLHWQYLPVAIPEFTHPDGRTKTAIFSGSAVVDKGNQSGLCPAGSNECMVAIYTSNVTEGEKHLDQHQSLAFSTDKGRTWTQYAKNPVLDLETKEFRDPNVFWYAPQQKWVMATVKATEHRAAFYESKNLKDWKLLSHFGPAADTSRVWECPALLPVPVLSESGQPEPGNSRWVLFISAGHPQKGYLGMQYFVGNFDGTTFTVDKDNPKPVAPAVGNVVDWGKDYYAAIPFSGLPAQHRKPVMIGWLNDWEYANKLPTSPFKGAMSMPREVALKRTPEGLIVVQTPIDGVTKLRGVKTERQRVKLTNQSLLLANSPNNVYELEARIRPGTAKSVGIRLAKNGSEETVIRYGNGRLELDRRQSGDVAFSDRFPSVEQAPLSQRNGVINLRIFVDKSVIEVFANDGERVITDFIFPNKDTGAIEFFAEGGSAEFEKITVWPLKSVRQVAE